MFSSVQKPRNCSLGLIWCICRCSSVHDHWYDLLKTLWWLCHKIAPDRKRRKIWRTKNCSMLPPVTRLPPAKAKALLQHQNNSQFYKTVLDWMRSKLTNELTNKLLPKMGIGFFNYGWRVGIVPCLCVDGSESKNWFLALTSTQLHKDFGDTNFLGVVATKLCATRYKKNQKAVKNCAKAGHNCGNRHQFSRRNCSSVFAPFPSDLHLVARIAVKKCRFWGMKW